MKVKVASCFYGETWKYLHKYCAHVDLTVFLFQSFLCNSVDCTWNHSVRNGCLWSNDELNPMQRNQIKISENNVIKHLGMMGCKERGNFSHWQSRIQGSTQEHQQHKTYSPDNNLLKALSWFVLKKKLKYWLHLKDCLIAVQEADEDKKN